MLLFVMVKLSNQFLYFDMLLHPIISIYPIIRTFFFLNPIANKINVFSIVLLML